MEKQKIQILEENINFIKENNTKSKPFVLFIHGFADESKRAISLYRQRDRNYCLYSIDLPCCGESTCNIEKPTIEYYGRVVTEFIKKIFKEQQIYIVTHSMGIGPALIANQNLKNIKHIFACTPANYIIHHEEKRHQELKSWMLPENLSDIEKSQIALFSKSELASLSKEYIKNSLKNIPQNYCALRKKTFEKLINEEMLNKNWALNNMKPLYRKNKNITIIFSDEDKFVLKSEIEQLIKENNFSYIEFKNTGHAIFYQRAEEINKIVINFIEKQNKFI